MGGFVIALVLLPILQCAALQGQPGEYFDILGTGCYDWRLAFRGTAHIQRTVYDAYRYGKGVPADVEEGCKTADWNAPCNNHYRNDDVLDNWSNVKEVLYGLVDDGNLVKVLRFRGAGSTYLDWMAQDRITESCWEDLKTSKPNYFGTDGHWQWQTENSRVQRSFFINKSYGSSFEDLQYGCPNDVGWTVAVDGPNAVCGWGKRETFPYFKYAAGQTAENWNSNNVRSADAIVVFVRYFNNPSEFYDLFNTGSKDWRLAFRGTARIGQQILPAYEDGTGVSLDVEAACKTADWRSPCTSHWRNDDALDNWKEIDQVLVGIVQNGVMVKTIVFRGEGTTSFNWFTPDRVVNSTWSDLSLGPHLYFSIDGDVKRKRRFFIQRNYGGCPKDAGWLVVADNPRRACTWEITKAFPIIKFAAGPKVGNWNTDQVLEADAIAVFLKYKDI